MTLAGQVTAAGVDGRPYVADLDDLRVERLGRVRIAPLGQKVAMQFVSGVVVLRGVFVDTATQAVFADPEALSLDLGWLYPRGATWSKDRTAVGFASRAVLAPVGRVVDPLGLLLEFCASLYVLDRAGRLDGSVLLGQSPANAESLVTEACELYDTELLTADADGVVYVGELVIPQFWVQEVGVEQTFVDVARWAVGGYSREFLSDLRERLGVDEEVERPVVAGPVGYQARYDHPYRLDRNLNEAVQDCVSAGAVLVLPSARLGIRARAAMYAALAHLVAVHGEDDANVAFMAKGARVDEVFVSEYVAGPCCLVADLVGLQYVPTVLPVDPASAGPPPHTRSPLIEGDVRRHLLSSAISGGGIRPVTPVPIWIATAIGDDDVLLRDWLDYHRAIGITRVVAFASAAPDHVRALLASERFAGFVDLRDEVASSTQERLACAARLAEGERIFLLPLEQGDFLLAHSAPVLERRELSAAMSFADEIEFPVHRVAGLRSVAEHNGGHERPATSSTYRFVEPAGRVIMAVPRIAEEESQSEDDEPVRVASTGIWTLRIGHAGRDRSRALIDEAERDAGLSSGRIVYDSSLAHAVLAAASADSMIGLS